jgi:hypothetical protein
MHDCVPQIYFHIDANEVVDTTGVTLQKVAGDNQPFDLRGGWYNVQNKPYRLWFHERIARSSLVDINRSLRISILRLHSEYSCLNNVLDAIRSGVISISPQSTASQALQDYLRNTQENILGEKKYLDSKLADDFLNYFQEKFNKLNPGQLTQLKQKISGMNIRPQLERNTNFFIDKFTLMSTNISNSQGIAVGEQAKVEGNSFQQINYTVPANLDYNQLEKELANLRNVLQPAAKTPEELRAVADIAQAEAEAKNKNGSKVIQYLKAGGQWVFETATKIGVSVVSDLIKTNM